MLLGHSGFECNVRIYEFWLECLWLLVNWRRAPSSWNQFGIPSKVFYNMPNKAMSFNFKTWHKALTWYWVYFMVSWWKINLIEAKNWFFWNIMWSSKLQNWASPDFSLLLNCDVDGNTWVGKDKSVFFLFEQELIARLEIIFVAFLSFCITLCILNKYHVRVWWSNA